MKKQKKNLSLKPKRDRQQESNSRIGDIDSYLGYWLRFVSNQVTAAFQQRLSEKGVTVAEWIALRFLLTHAPCSLTKLSEEMGMDKGALSRLVDRLTKRELIKCTPSPTDRRQFFIELTSAGLNLVPDLARIADENDAYFFGSLKKKEIDLMAHILKDIVNKHGFRGKPLS